MEKESYGFYSEMEEEAKKLFVEEREKLLNEITYAYNWNLIDRTKLENLINNRPDFLKKAFRQEKVLNFNGFQRITNGCKILPKLF